MKKTCKNCKEEFKKPAEATKSTFEHRKYCNPECFRADTKTRSKVEEDFKKRFGRYPSESELQQWNKHFSRKNYAKP